MYKAIISFIILMFFLLNLSAQKESNIKLKLEAGLLWDLNREQIDISPFLYIEPKVKTSKNTDIGFRMGVAENPERIHLADLDQYNFDNRNVSSIFLIVPTFDYHFSKNDFHPYLGLGVGYYFLTTSKDFFTIGISSDLLEVNIKNQIGFLLRGGLNFRKFIVGLEFNYIPKADIEIPNGQIIGTIDYSNIGLSIGYVIGIGKS